MMKYLFIPLLISSAFAQDIKPLKGSYTCLRGNDKSICDQVLRPVMVGSRLSGLYIEYVGWCGSMGPYFYPCLNNVCEDSAIRVRFFNEANYSWENRPNKKFCEFGKTTR